MSEFYFIDSDGDGHDGLMRRYSTWNEAVAGHARGDRADEAIRRRAPGLMAKQLFVLE